MATRTPEPTVAPDPPAADPTLARVLALLESQQEEMTALREELRQAKSAQGASFKPMQPPSGVRRGRGGRFGNLDAALAQGQRRGWGEREAMGISSQILIDIHGEKIPDRMLDAVGPRFYDGDAVRINPDATREGFPEGLTWGDVLARLAPTTRKGQRANPHGVGTVTKVLWLTDDEGWKYKVVVPGITGARPDGFHDHELLPA